MLACTQLSPFYHLSVLNVTYVRKDTWLSPPISGGLGDEATLPSSSPCPDVPQRALQRPQRQPEREDPRGQLRGDRWWAGGRAGPGRQIGGQQDQGQERGRAPLLSCSPSWYASLEWAPASGGGGGGGGNHRREH